MNHKQIGKHEFSGSCAPGVGWVNYINFSVGIFEWMPCNFKGKPRMDCCKRGKVKVRVSGNISCEHAVYKKAREICQQLDAGTYDGPRHVIIK